MGLNSCGLVRLDRRAEVAEGLKFGEVVSTRSDGTILVESRSSSTVSGGHEYVSDPRIACDRIGR